MKTVVLGAGITGVITAYYLHRSGHDVTVIDRCDKSAAECSFANGGQLSYSHIEPWASPSSLRKIPTWLFKKNSPLVFRPQADINMWIWSLRFLSCCRRSKVEESSRNMMRLSLYSKKCMEQIDSDLKLEYHQANKGIIHTFANRKNLEANLRQAEFQKELGCDFRLLENRKECEEIEPALKYSPTQIVGGIFFPMDASGSANIFAVKMSEYLQNNGVKFEYNTNIEGFTKKNGEIISVKTDKGEFSADSYVVSMGAYSKALLKKISINVPIYPLKGYSVSIKVKDERKAPIGSITNQSDKIVFSRLGDIIRVAGTAEIAGYDNKIRKSRIKTIKKMVKKYLPECGDIDSAEPWACLRPSTPDGSPIIGKTKYNNVYLNTGHGTLGWTLAAGSALAICDIINNNEPEISLAGLNLERF